MKATDPAAGTLTGLLECQASKTPDRVAINFQGSTLTYRELHEAANALADRLANAGVAAGTVVGLGCARSLEMVVGLLAILKAGAAYLPLDPALPAARLRFMAADARLPVLLQDESLAVHDLALPGVDVVDLAGCLDERSARSPAASRLTTPPEPAYVLYTSGSTGTPKGVVVPHGAVVNMLAAFRETPGFPPGSRMLALATVSFDIAGVEIWMPLATGECLTLACRADALDPARLAALLCNEKITVMQGTPATWQALIESGWAGAAGLIAVCGGEPLSDTLADALRGRCAQLWNLYGPTETTVFSTGGRLDVGDRITVGRPVRNTRIYVLDADRRPVPAGVTGEMYVGGAGVAIGYLNRPELTAERFVSEPGHDGERMYKTGDLARWLPDGRIDLLGRIDHQVKIRGQRVELGEVERAILHHSGAAAAVVILREIAPGDHRLIAYVVPAAAGGPASAGELQRLLRAVLPSHMVPAAFLGLSAMPITTGGKVDRGALPAPLSSDLAVCPDVAVSIGGDAEQTPFERRLGRLWARVLQLDSVGPDDDFFALGGHSLLAVRLVVAIEREFNVSMTVSTLIDGAATVRALAARLDAPESRTRSAVSARPTGPQIVRSHPHSDQPPLIVFFPSRESLLAMRHLQLAFDDRQPVIGVLAGLDSMSRYARTGGIPMIASEAREAVRPLQPAGAPYRIAGYSFGGLVAYEVAGQLIGEGADVDWLALIDARSPAQATRETSMAQYLERSRGRSWRTSLRIAAERARSESIVIGADAAARTVRRPLERFDELGARRLLRGYTPVGHTLPLDLFLTRSSAAQGDPTLGWRSLHRGPVRTHDIAGDHHSIVRGPAARQLGERLMQALPGVMRLTVSGDPCRAGGRGLSPDWAGTSFE